MCMMKCCLRAGICAILQSISTEGQVSVSMLAQFVDVWCSGGDLGVFAPCIREPCSYFPSTGQSVMFHDTI